LYFSPCQPPIPIFNIFWYQKHIKSIKKDKKHLLESLTKRIVIFAASSPHEDLYYKKSLLYDFPIPTSDTSVLANAVSDVINDIFKANTRFYRFGIGAIELESELYQQADMFSVNSDNPQMMKCLAVSP